MVMQQGKSGSGDKPSLSADEAEAAADAFRPAWDLSDDTFETAAPDTTASPSTVASPVSPASPAGPPATVNLKSTVIGVAPAPVVTTKLGGISPEAAAVVAAANAAAKHAATQVSPAIPVPGKGATVVMRAPIPSSEALDSDAVIAVEAATVKARSVPPPAPPVAAPAAQPVSVPPPSIAGSTVVMATSPTRSAKPPAAPPAFTPTDPFRNASATDVDDDLGFVKKKTNPLVFVGVGGALLVAVLLVVKLGSSPETPPASRTTAQAGGPQSPSPTNDIPPPPPKDETPATTKTAEPTSAKTAEPTSARTAEPVAAKAPEPPTHAASPVTRPTDPPRPIAVAPRNPPALPKASPPPAPAQPKSPPKATGGGIVRDSPF